MTVITLVTTARYHRQTHQPNLVLLKKRNLTHFDFLGNTIVVLIHSLFFRPNAIRLRFPKHPNIGNNLPDLFFR